MAALPLHDSIRRRAPDERPQQIVDAALAVFDEQGLDGARLDDIARRAGIAKGTIYLYFPNKEELFREVVRSTLVSRLSLAATELAERPADQPAVEQLCDYMREWWNFIRTPATLAVYRLVIGELHRFPELMAFYLEEVVKPARALVARIVERGIERGEFRPVDAMASARTIAALLVGHALWYCKQEASRAMGNDTPQQIFDQLCDFALHALRPHA
jgi:AcrR family transcriptional regulator